MKLVRLTREEADKAIESVNLEELLENVGNVSIEDYESIKLEMSVGDRDGETVYQLIAKVKNGCILFKKRFCYIDSYDEDLDSEDKKVAYLEDEKCIPLYKLLIKELEKVREDGKDFYEYDNTYVVAKSDNEWDDDDDFSPTFITPVIMAIFKAFVDINRPAFSSDDIFELLLDSCYSWLVD